jgi:DNA-binding MarR family transcriptional regulator
LISSGNKGLLNATRQANESPLRSMVRCYGLIERVMNPYFAQFGISAAQWGVLVTLDRFKSDYAQGMRLSDLGELLLVRAPSVTSVVDRLERSGLVTRATQPGDLRAKLVRLTDSGQRLVDRIASAHGRQVDRVFAGLSMAQRQRLQRLLLRMTTHLETLLDGPAAEQEIAVG